MDQVQVRRRELTRVGATLPHTLRVMPPGKKLCRVVVGDQDGSVGCFQWKKGTATEVFVSTDLVGGPVQRVELGSSAVQDDKVFAVTGTSIQGISKKGRPFFRFDVNQVTEAIRTLYVRKHDLWFGCTFTAHMFSDKDLGQEQGFYLSPDAINDMVGASVAPGEGGDNGGDAVAGGGDGEEDKMVVVLACEDSMVRVLDRSELYYEAAIDAPVATVVPFTPSTDREISGGRLYYASDVVYATGSGALGTLGFTEDRVRRGWVIPGTRAGKRTAGVASVNVDVDFSRDGTRDAIVGRVDGSMEVWSLDEGDPHPFASASVGESITSVGSGIVTTYESDDVVVATYSGRVIAFTQDESVGGGGGDPDLDDLAVPTRAAEKAEKMSVATGGGVDGSAAAATEAFVEAEDAMERERAAEWAKEEALRQEQLRADILRLQKELRAKRAEAAAAEGKSVSVGGGPSQVVDFDWTETFKSSGSWILHPDTATFTMSIDCNVPIERVVFRCDVPSEFECTTPGLGLEITAGGPVSAGLAMDEPASRAMYSAGGAVPHVKGVFAFESKVGPGGAVGAGTRLDATVRTVEGYRGVITCYPVPQLEIVTGKALRFKIHPLCLHQVVHEIDSSLLEGRPINRIEVTGEFSLADMHNWLRNLLPSIPAKVPAAENVTYHFMQTSLGTVLMCAYSRGYATFESDNVSCMSILKESITRDATEAKVKLAMAPTIRPECLEHNLRLLAPKLDYLHNLARRVGYVEGLLQIKAHEPDHRDFLDAELLDILDHVDDYRENLKVAPKRMAALHGQVIDLFVDFHKFQGQNVNNRCKELVRLLASYEGPDALVDFCYLGARPT